MAIYKHGGGPELQPTEKNQRGDFGGTTVPCSIFFFKVPSSLDVCVSYIKKSTQTEMCQFLS